MNYKLLLLSGFAAIGCGPRLKSLKTDADKIKFEKLIFHTTGCYGLCPTYHLQMDKTKKMKLYAEKIYKPNSSHRYIQDSSRMGYFTGIVSDSLYGRIMHELDSIGLDSLTFNHATCCDAPIITIIIYYGGKRKFLRSMFPPVKAEKLIDILYSVCYSSKMNRTTEKLEIENEKYTGRQ